MMGEECSLPQDVSNAEFRTNWDLRDLGPGCIGSRLQSCSRITAQDCEPEIFYWIVDTTLRRLSTSWDLHELDPIKSFVRPPVTR